MDLARLPVLGICGYSGSGKTTLIEAALPVLLARGLRVTVIKHDAHGLDIDRRGKDSDRFFRAGADVLLAGPGESALRTHCDGPGDLAAAVDAAIDHCDLVLVEGHKDTPVEKLWLSGPEGDAPPPHVQGVRAVLGRNSDRPAALLELLDAWLPARWLATPVRACILIGGRSSRMGSPKHLLVRQGRTWLARTAELLALLVEQVVLAGRGDVPEDCQNLPRLADIPDSAGPMAGVLAAMRWSPRSSWLVAACDHPALSRNAVEWLLSTRRPGVWGTVPLTGEERPEPLLAHYDYRARPVFEALACEGVSVMRRVLDEPKVAAVAVPDHLTYAWCNVNTRADLEGFQARNEEATR